MATRAFTRPANAMIVSSVMKKGARSCGEARPASASPIEHGSASRFGCASPSRARPAGCAALHIRTTLSKQAVLRTPTHSETRLSRGIPHASRLAARRLGLDLVYRGGHGVERAWSEAWRACIAPRLGTAISSHLPSAARRFLACAARSRADRRSSARSRRSRCRAMILMSLPQRTSSRRGRKSVTVSPSILQVDGHGRPAQLECAGGAVASGCLRGPGGDIPANSDSAVLISRSTFGVRHSPGAGPATLIAPPCEGNI